MLVDDGKKGERDESFFFSDFFLLFEHCLPGGFIKPKH